MEKLRMAINGRVELVWEDQVLRSTVEDLNDKYFGISIPTTKDGKSIPLNTGDKAEFVYYSDSSLFKFDSIVLGRKMDTINLLIIEIPEEYSVIQRREYFRVNKLDYLDIAGVENSVEMKYKLDTEKSTNKGPRKVFKKAILMDLSGGGMRIKVDKEIKVGDIIHFFLKTNKEELELFGKVIRVEIDNSNYHVCGVCFLYLNKIEREKIIQYTFEIMRKQINKAL